MSEDSEDDEKEEAEEEERKKVRYDIRGGCHWPFIYFLNVFAVISVKCFNNWGKGSLVWARGFYSQPQKVLGLNPRVS